MNEIGDVFGLKTNCNSGSPQTLVQYNQSANSNNTAVASSLSLEDKRRLADQQEQLSRFKTQQSDRNIIVPKPVQPEKKVNLARDLTSTLMDRNLALMSTSTSSGNLSNISNSNYPSNAMSANYNIQPFSNGFKSSLPPPPPGQPQKPQIDISAFDGICNLGSASRPKLNEMPARQLQPMGIPIQSLSTNQNRPIVMSHSNRANPGAAKLSSNDIDDLLK